MKRFLLLLVLIFTLGIMGPAIAEDVELGWDANTDPIDGYNVYEKQGEAGFVFQDAIPCTENDPVCCEYTTSQLLWETTYSWFVTAFKGPSGESGPSNVVSHTTGTEPVYNPDNPRNCFIRAINP